MLVYFEGGKKNEIGEMCGASVGGNVVLWDCNCVCRCSNECDRDISVINAKIAHRLLAHN